MDMTGEYRIEAPREVVWRALNDPEILKSCIPGCEEIQQISPTELTAKVLAKVGPVKARFSGAVTLSDLNPPESYKISGEGKGGAAGFARGGAHVRLTEDGSATLLNYEVHAQIGGKLAQLGARLVNGTAKKMADDFFATFAERLHAPVEAVAPTEAKSEPESEAAARAKAEAEAKPIEGVAAAEAERAAAVGVTMPPSPPPSMSSEMPPSAPAGEKGKGLHPVVWIAGLVILALVLLLMFE